jgi:hypothetical protein
MIPELGNLISYSEAALPHHLHILNTDGVQQLQTPR